MNKKIVSSAAFFATGRKSMRDGFGTALHDQARKQWDVVAVSADLANSLRLGAFAEDFPTRFFEVGVAEQNMIGVAAGLAAEGLLPFAASFAAFSPGRTFDQIRVSVAYSQLPVVIVGGHTGLSVGPDGASHQMLEDLALMQSLPGIKIYSPCDFASAQAVVIRAVQERTPMYIRLARVSTRAIFSQQDVLHNDSLLIKEGSDAILIAHGTMVDQALEVAFALESAGISVAVCAVFCLKPFPQSVLDELLKHEYAFVMEEHQEFGGFGSQVALHLSEYASTLKLKVLAVQDTFGESGSSEDLWQKYGLSSLQLQQRILQFMGR